MKPTWEECAAAGMTKAEAARAMGVYHSAAGSYAKRHGLAFRNGRKSNGANFRNQPNIGGRVNRILSQMTPQERDNYRALRRPPAKRSIEDALRLVGRADLIAQVPQ